MPREKIIKMGVEALEDFELLAVLLETGIKNEPILEYSKRIISELNGLDDIINMSIEDWMKIKGIKEAKASKLIAFLEFSKRIFQYNKQIISLKKSEQVYEYVKYDLIGKFHEELIVLYVNVKCNLLKKKIVTSGKVNVLYVDVKDIINDSIKTKASGVFLIHNHPSGDTTPSNSDIELTNNLKKALSFFEVQLLDHLIIGHNSFFSFSCNNLL